MNNHSTQRPDVLFEKSYDLLWGKENDTEYYLTHVEIRKPTNGFPELDSAEFSIVEFTMSYGITERSPRSLKRISYCAQFAKEGSGMKYKIFESAYLSSWATRANTQAPFQPMSFEASLPKYSFAGYSDDESLQAVQVWKIAQKDFAPESE